MVGHDEKAEFGEFLSTYAEIHAFIIGIAYGISRKKGLDDIPKNNEDVKKEYHYACTGYVIGEVLEAVLIILVSHFAIQVL